MVERHSSPGFGKMLDVAYSPGISAAVFTLFVAIGCAYIVVAKLEGVAQFYVKIVQETEMLAYALLVCLARPLRLRDDQSGDNLYYMGFLLTLTSLGVSLYQFTATGAAAEFWDCDWINDYGYRSESDFQSNAPRPDRGRTDHAFGACRGRASGAAGARQHCC